AEDEGFASAEKEPVLNFTPFSDYEFPGIEGDLGVILVGVAGTLAVFAGALGLGRLLSRGHGQTATDEGATPGGGAEPGAGRGAGPAVGRVPGHGPGHGVLGHRHSGHEHAPTQKDAG
ncbi:MAG TPA: PDGLE domain-containing protein, partial [Thermoleophilia bacterium]|nr:PDGLE domain-containing protein [Thermoleophilia bacterium]